MRFAVSVNNEIPQDMYAVSEKYYTECFDQEWAAGVLNYARITTMSVSLQKGRKLFSELFMNMQFNQQKTQLMHNCHFSFSICVKVMTSGKRRRQQI